MKLILFVVIFISCKRNRISDAHTFFYIVPESSTNIHFENTLKETDKFNIIQYLYFYNGGGVAIGDINNDGLPDIYFTSNQESNKLYLNKGNFQFDDITLKANVSGIGNWTTGVTMADVNGDGWLDIFVCGVGSYKDFNGRNQLFINNGDLTFSDKTNEYGLAFQGFSTQAAFFDYDNDGDLDMYLLNHSVHTSRSYGEVLLRFQTDRLAGDKLYRNELIPHGTHGFTEVTSLAGIHNSQIGYGLGIGVSDINMDGFLDIYVANDFHENDYLYINQGDGTFKQILEKSIPHTSRFSMGIDIADINNDGLSDIISLDMLPKSEDVIKSTAGEDPYEIFQFKLQFGYHYQFARNTLQLNHGVDKENTLLFSDIAPLAGIAATDWSWSSLFADFDNDGYKDLFITNGIVRRPNDLDYINYISTDSAQRYYTDKQLYEKMPSGKVSNIFFKNQHDLTFNDVSKEWIGDEPKLSSGAAYADLDSDGDLDLVINNINSKASIWRNDIPDNSTKFLKLKLNGEAPNQFGIGTKVFVYADDKVIYYEQMPTRGWLSSVDYTMHIGLGRVDKIDSAIIVWPGGRFQTIRDIQPGNIIEVQQKDAGGLWNYHGSTQLKQVLKEEADILYSHKENPFNAFNVERLIPHMLSTQGPKISTGDINGDGLDDFFVGGGQGQSGAIFFQTKSGSFEQSFQKFLVLDSLAEDTGSAMFDANGDGKLDLIVVSGGQEYEGASPVISPRLYLNDGKGNLIRAEKNLPEIFLNASCVKPADLDGDGDLDVFIGGRVVAGQYGITPRSYILINNGRGVFSDQTSDLLPDALGMITDALWLDVNGDNRLDLVVVGEWMPITILIQNRNGTFSERTEEYGLEKTSGWWNTISSYDFDHDGDIDFVVGNVGLNSKLRPGINEPVSLYVGDIDGNGSLEHILTYYNEGKSHPFVSRDELIKQVPSLKRKFLKYSTYKKVNLEDIIDDKEKFIRRQAFTFASCYVENLGNGKFSVRELPLEAQMSPIFSFGINDINADGHADLMMIGNLYAVQPEFGRYDAGLGLVMLGDGKGNFKPLTPQSSGFIVKGEGRDIKTLVNSKGERVFLVARNNNSLKVFKLKR